MAVPAEIESRLDDIFDEKGITNSCGSCGRSAFNREDFEIFGLFRPTLAGASYTADHEKVFTMTCSNCGFMRIYSAEKLGILD